MSQTSYPIVVTLLSYVIRTGIIFLFLYYIARTGQWASILFWLMGFILTRIALSNLLKREYFGKKDSPKKAQSKVDKE
jgi:F0F1-type ATP synthase assembly protein I